MKPILQNNSRYKQGYFIPKNPNKYIGDPNNIIYRSDWERKICNYCDIQPDILKWNSEGIVIEYFYTGDKKVHRYFIDFYIESKKEKLLVEVKPYKETILPNEPKRKTKKAMTRYLNEIMIYEKNMCKWEAAKIFAKKNGMKFTIWDEYKLGIKKR